MTAPEHFHGFPKGALRFFDALAANNSAEWFHAHKADYERDLRSPMSDLVVDLSADLAHRDLPLSGDPKRALFRINRDIRFSKNKSPYKTNISAVLSRDGNKQGQGSFYLQIGPDETFAAIGFYALEPGSLSAIRDRIVANQDKWRAVANGLASAGLTLSREGALLRLPRGYEADEVGDLADTLKLKSFVVSMPLDTAALESRSLVGRLADFAAKGHPLLQFGWDALEH